MGDIGGSTQTSHTRATLSTGDTGIAWACGPLSSAHKARGIAAYLEPPECFDAPHLRRPVTPVPRHARHKSALTNTSIIPPSESSVCAFGSPPAPRWLPSPRVK
jgi:hypothetical protein